MMIIKNNAFYWHNSSEIITFRISPLTQYIGACRIAGQLFGTRWHQVSNAEKHSSDMATSLAISGTGKPVGKYFDKKMYKFTRDLKIWWFFHEPQIQTSMIFYLNFNCFYKSPAPIYITQHQARLTLQCRYSNLPLALLSIMRNRSLTFSFEALWEELHGACTTMKVGWSGRSQTCMLCTNCFSW